MRDYSRSPSSYIQQYGRMDSGQTVPGQQAQTLAHLQALKKSVIAALVSSRSHLQ